MKKIPLLLLAICIFLLADAQKMDKRDCRVITAFLKSINGRFYPYYLEKWSLPYQNNSIDLSAVLNRGLFESGLVRPEDNIRLDSPVTASEARYMKETCSQHPLRHRWNANLLTSLGVVLGDTSEPQAPRTVRQVLMTRIRMTRPLFSEDGNKALFYAEYFAEDNGGEGSIWIFQRKGRKWHSAMSINIWIE